MKKYLLDTDTIIYFLKGDENIIKKVESTVPAQLYTSVINCAELLFGANNSDYKKHNLRMVNGLISNLSVISLDIGAAKIFGELKAYLKKKGELIADMDLLIASIAIAGNYILITNNTKHFARIKSLVFENWRTV